MVPQQDGLIVRDARDSERAAIRDITVALGLHTMDFMKAAVRMYEGMGFVRVPEVDFTPAPGVAVKGYRLDLTG